MELEAGNVKEGEVEKGDKSIEKDENIALEVVVPNQTYLTSEMTGR